MSRFQGVIAYIIEEVPMMF